MSTEHTDPNQTLPLTLVSSFGPPDMVIINTTMSAGEPVMTNQVPNPVMTIPHVNTTNPSTVNTSTTQGVSGHPIHLEWAWFRLEGHCGCRLGLAWTECWSITLVIHQELGVIPMWIQKLNYQDVLIEFYGKADAEWIAQKFVRMEFWMGPHVTSSVFLVVMKKGFYSPGEENG